MKNDVKIWEEIIKIPTYGIGKADLNPMFLEKRVYQASSGKVYPYPFIDKISDKKFDKEYKVVYLENKYIKLMMMPELGGRIQTGLDKTNNYDFFYRNQVIKPALVGLAGPWISGGVEFNWPQHHRPSTFQEVEYKIVDNGDGSKTLWMGEIEEMSGLRGEVGVTLYPDKAYVEVNGVSYNRTNLPQNFLWWANVAVSVHEGWQTIFPPDVDFVADHAKGTMTSFPLADSTYYNINYAERSDKERDISRYDNITVPMSYMALGSKYDFFGGYDHKKQAEIIHVADHHVSPGKKQWTWGSGEFGQAWDRQLTDEDGPYFELMAGVFTDNQPDFTWLQPFERKNFKQFWYPYKNIGWVKNANLDGAISLDVINGEIKAGVYTPYELKDAEIMIKYNDTIIFSEKTDLSPESAFMKSIKFDKEKYGLELILMKDTEILSYKIEDRDKQERPNPAQEIPHPENLDRTEDLYSAGHHLEQYRHATYEPENYYREALERDPKNFNNNNALGLLLMKRGNFAEAVKYFETAVKKSLNHNPNPYDCEAHYNLGVCQAYVGKYSEAYDSLYKSIWDGALKSQGYFKLAELSMLSGNYKKALDEIENALKNNSDNIRGVNLKTSILRKLEIKEEALTNVETAYKITKLNYTGLFELYLLTGEEKYKNELIDLLKDNSKTYLELAIDYGSAGMYVEAVELLESLINREIENTSPMVYYYAGYYAGKMRDQSLKEEYYKAGASKPTDYCFPHRLTSIIVLEDVIASKEDDYKALYYLGNLFDKKQYNRAIDLWEKSRDINDSFSIVHRNLGIAYFNKEKDLDKAITAYEKAFECNSSDSRVLFELDQLYKIANKDTKERLELLKSKFIFVEERDDLYNEMVKLYNQLGDFKEALRMLGNRNFHPWEGGEGKVIEQYVFAKVEAGKSLIAEEKYEEALIALQEAKIYPFNLGEGKITGTPEANINYLMGVCYEALDKEDEKVKYYTISAEESVESSSNLSYKPEKLQMNYYQGLSLHKLGRIQEGDSVFENLISYADNKIQQNVQIAYFAISAPDVLIFDKDLNIINKAHCHYLKGLGLLGLKKYDEAKLEFIKALDLDINLQEVISIIKSSNLEINSQDFIPVNEVFEVEVNSQEAVNE